MEKRVLVASLLSVLILFAFRAWYPAPTDPNETPPGEATPPAVQPPVRDESVPPVSQAPTDSLIQAESEQEIVVETPVITARVSNAGGVLHSLRLKNYRDGEGRPVELIDQQLVKEGGYPLALRLADSSLDRALTGVRFRLTEEAKGVAVFEYASGGLYVRKRLVFDPEEYRLRVETVVTNLGAAVPHSVVWPGGFGDQSVVADATHQNVVHLDGEKFSRTALSKLQDTQTFVSSAVGLEDQYFLVAAVLPTTQNVVVEHKLVKGPEGIDKPLGILAVPVTAALTQFYLGPKDESRLQAVDPQLAGVIDYGFFDFITRPLLVGLLWVHQYVRNFGWAIIILTLALNFVLFPLRLKQQRSMQEMQRIQPQLKTLQDKRGKLKANDPRRREIEAEMMELYRVNGINPMGGCLPLLLQLPVMIAFYNMLAVSIELRRAPWIFWIEDLSQKDPYYVIPILMALTMLISQKMTPTTLDPVQARMMLIMPLMFTVMFLTVQSGLTLYWLTSNVAGIGQQFLINRFWNGPVTPKRKGQRSRQQPEK